MAYSSTNPARAILQLGFAGGGTMFRYVSTHNSTQVGGVTGFFAGCGAGSAEGSNSATPPSNVGMRVGDLVICSESTGGGTPGRTFMGMVISSTADQASTIAATGWNAKYDVTISSATT